MTGHAFLVRSSVNATATPLQFFVNSWGNETVIKHMTNAFYLSSEVLYRCMNCCCDCLCITTLYQLQGHVTPNNISEYDIK
jgi:hypothetical protein